MNKKICLQVDKKPNHIEKATFLGIFHTRGPSLDPDTVEHKVKVCHPCPNPLEKVASGRVLVYLGTVRVRRESNHVRATMSMTTEQGSVKCELVDRSSCLNWNMAAHGTCWSWKAGQMVTIGVSKVKNNTQSNEVDSTVHGCALHSYRDALKWSKGK